MKGFLDVRTARNRRECPRTSDVIRFGTEAALALLLKGTSVRCPQCEAPLSVQEVDKFDPAIPNLHTPVRVAVCGFCDFLHEF